MYGQRILNKGDYLSLTSCSLCLNSAVLLMLKCKLFYLFGPIQTSQTGGQLYSDTAPYGECSLINVETKSKTNFSVL